MDDRMQTGRGNAPDRSGQSAPQSNDFVQNGRRESSDGVRATSDRSSAARPALTDRERNERWPVD
jgi:hypothetical protein